MRCVQPDDQPWYPGFRPELPMCETGWKTRLAAGPSRKAPFLPPLDNGAVGAH